MGGTRVETMPTVPAPSAADLPQGVAAASMLWEETLGAGGYTGKELGRGARLRLVDLHGDACVSMLIFNAERPIERGATVLVVGDRGARSIDVIANDVITD